MKKMSMQSHKTEYKVSDLYVAAFLLANSVELISVDRTDHKRAVFIFSSEDSESLLAAFWLKKASIEPRSFIAAIKEAKELLYSE